jgi:hypothetical protein
MEGLEDVAPSLVVFVGLNFIVEKVSLLVMNLAIRLSFRTEVHSVPTSRYIILFTTSRVDLMILASNVRLIARSSRGDILGVRPRSVEIRVWHG